MLSGLDPNHNVIDDAAYASVEHLIVDDDPPKPTTRASRNGRSAVSYDMKVWIARRALHPQRHLPASGSTLTFHAW